FMIGLQLEKKDLVDRLKKNSHNRDIHIIELGETEKLKKRLIEDEDEHEHAHEEEHGHDHEKGQEEEHGHEHGAHDPHVWLGIPEAIIIVETIRDHLKNQDPAHKQGYQDRAANYIQKLRDLQAYGVEALKNKKNRKLISMHESLRYFARSFDLKVVGTI